MLEWSSGGAPAGTAMESIDGLARGITDSLRRAGTRERAVKEKQYLKSELTHLGVSVPVIRRAVSQLARAHRELPRAAVLRLVRALWSAPIHEHRMAAVEMLVRYGERLEQRDLRLVERLVRESRTWALVDALAVFVAGGLVERFGELGRDLDRWSRDRDFWVRRAAMLALLRPLREGRGDFERFAGYADAMLDEKEFFIRKAIGWVLRETSKRRPDLVSAWLAPRASRASGVTMREAIKYLPARDRARLG
jgi:3-methyladenine DNA glycosylase AlkD